MVFLSIVGRVLGPEAVGYFGLTLRAAGLIAPFRAAAGRVGLPALVPIAHLPDSLRNAVRSVVETELLFSVPITILAVGIYSFSVKHLLGAQWMSGAISGYRCRCSACLSACNVIERDPYSRIFYGFNNI